MKVAASSRVSAVLALFAATCFTVHCGNEAGPSTDDRPTDTKLARDGQSGSEANGAGGLNYLSCPCGFPEWLPGAGALLRVTLLARELGMSESSTIAKCRPSQRATAWDGPPPLCARLRLRVEEVLQGVVAPAVGNEIEADSDGFLPCFWHLDRVDVGQQALAAVSWPLGELPACAARQECSDACVQTASGVCSDAGVASSDAGDGSGGANERGYPPALCGRPDVAADCASLCQESTVDRCPSRPLPSAQVLQQGGSAQLTPWGESLLFAETDQARLTVPASELSLLWGDHQRCVARFGDWAELPGAFPGPPP